MEAGISAVLRQIQTGGASPLLIAIDGRCAAGKTTLAAALQEAIHCNVIHMDDFYLRPGQRTEQRMREPGGNVDRERFLEEVMLPLSRGQRFSYRKYDCRSMELSSPVRVEPGAVTVIEGSYSCHPALWDFYGLRIFLDVDEEEQLRRIRRRNGEQALAVFRDRWIPMEERYFETYRIQQCCDLTLRDLF